MHAVRRTTAGLTAAAAVTAGLTLLSPATASAAPAFRAETTPASCGVLPAEVKGAPHLKAGSPAQDAIYHDGRGWHLRVTKERSARLVFSGTITSSAPIRYERRRLERNDRVLLSSDRRTLSFRFTNVGYIDGIDFRTACAQSLTFSLQAGNSQAPLNRIGLGRSGAHPTSNPFTVSRSPRPQAAPVAPTAPAPAAQG